MNVDHSDTPRVFNVAGQLIEYNDCTGEALVVGDGRLLVRDERPDAESVAGSPVAAERDIAFGRKGTTLFKWQQKLHMTRSVDLRYDVKITGDVSVQHKGLDRETATMTCGELQVELLRQPTNNTAESASSAGACSPAFDLGGSADLRYLRAENAVYIRTPGRDIDCGRFVLDYNTQVAELAAAHRRTGFDPRPQHRPDPAGRPGDLEPRHRRYHHSARRRHDRKMKVNKSTNQQVKIRSRATSIAKLRSGLKVLTC